MTVQATSRRALLTGATALSAVAVSSFVQPAAATATQGTSFPELEAKFVAAYARFKDRFAADEEFNRRRDEAFLKQYGRPFEWQNGEPSWLEKARDDFEQKWPYDDPDLKEWEAISNETVPLALEILKQRPQSLHDLALQAQATTLLNEPLWLNPTESDWLPCDPDFSLRMLVDNVLGFCGKRALPGLNVFPVPQVNHRSSSEESDYAPPPPNARLLASDLNPAFALIKEHSYAKKRLCSAVAEQDEIDILTNFGKSHTAETRRRRRNADRQVTRWYAKEKAALYKLLELPTLSNVGDSILVDYLRKEFATRDFDNTSELQFLLDALYERATPVWLHEKFPKGSSQALLENQEVLV